MTGASKVGVSTETKPDDKFEKTSDKDIGYGFDKGEKIVCVFTLTHTKTLRLIMHVSPI